MEASACVSISRCPVMLWMRTWATCSTLTRLEEGLSDLQKPLPVPAILWYFSNFNYSTQGLADLSDSFPRATSFCHRVSDRSWTQASSWFLNLFLKSCSGSKMSSAITLTAIRKLAVELLITPKQVNFKSLPWAVHAPVRQLRQPLRGGAFVLKENTALCRSRVLL